MRKLRVDLVDEVGEVGGCFVIDILEEHHSFEILREILDLAIRQFSLQYFYDIFFLRWLDLFSQVDDLLLDVDEPPHISSYLTYSQRIKINNLPTDSLNLNIRFIGNLIYKISYGKFRTLR